MGMQNAQGGIPVVILKDGAQQTKGRDAQKNNITAAKLIAEIVRTSLGPRGMDKMLVDSLGDVTITNDGATILKEIDVQHPAAKMLVEIAKATEARIVTNLDDLFDKDLGSAENVEEIKIETDRWVFVEGCKHPKAVTVLVRGGSQRVVDEVERSVHDALMVVKDVMENPMIVAGGGAPETYAATKLREWAKSLEGREQLAVEKFADSLEVIPITLAENAGMDPIDTLTSLRSKQLKGNKWTGIDVMKGVVASMHSTDIFEPLSVKIQIILSATEVTSMILRIDDVIAIAKSSGPPGGGEGMGGMGGMGGMPGMGGMGGMPPMDM